jgi:hypothetical protein
MIGLEIVSSLKCLSDGVSWAVMCNCKGTDRQTDISQLIFSLHSFGNSDENRVN